MTENDWEQKLNIQTAGRQVPTEDGHHHPYEPTPYAVLQRLAESGHLKKEMTLIDYGCGKGRAAIFLQRTVGCRTVGVEYDPALFAAAEQNRRFSGAGEAVSFCCGHAESFAVGEADAFYFFNPFTEEILQAVLRQILAAYYEHPRRMRLFFYYPHDDTRRLLLGDFPELTLLEELDCSDLFAGDDPREQILIFGLEPM